MSDTMDDKIQKVRTLYERTTNPGEKAAAYEALKRLLGRTEEEENSGVNWLEDMRNTLLSKNFYLCCQVGNSYLYSKVRDRDGEKVWLYVNSHSKGTWNHFKAYTGRKYVFTDRRPDNQGITKDHLQKVLV